MIWLAYLITILPLLMVWRLSRRKHSWHLRRGISATGRRTVEVWRIQHFYDFEMAVPHLGEPNPYRS